MIYGGDSFGKHYTFFHRVTSDKRVEYAIFHNSELVKAGRMVALHNDEDAGFLIDKIQRAFLASPIHKK